MGPLPPPEQTQLSAPPPFSAMHVSSFFILAYRSVERPEREGGQAKVSHPASSAFASILRVVVEISACPMMVVSMHERMISESRSVEVLRGEFCDV